MPFSRHAFISYAHVDNQPLPTEKDGWVTLFHAALDQLLSGYVGANADIWRDPKLDGNDIISDEILQQLPGSAALVAVLSPRYLKSEWCAKELTKFCEAAEAAGGVVIGTKSRVFKILKTPIGGADGLHPVVGQMKGYEFYEIGDDDAPRQLDPAFGDKERQEFLRKVNKVAWDIKNLTEQLKEAAAAGAAPRVELPVVYLAECARDRRDAREALEAELQRFGYTVLPDRQLPTDENEYMAEVKSLLARCRLSIHLVGSAYGAVPDGTGEQSIVMLQNQLAVEACKSGPLQRVISLPAGTESPNPAQQAFIERLHIDANTQYGADLITGSMEELKSTIFDALKKIADESKGRKKQVHVLCDAQDRKATVPLLKILKERGVEVSLPVFTGDPLSVRKANDEMLTRADAVIVFYGSGDEAWKFHQLTIAKQSRPGRAGEYVYLAEPMTDDKEILRMTAEGFDENSLMEALKL